ncbi:MAG: phenylalanine--tRNA ligase subunit alpha [Acidobacteria bacterium]|nr:phenylalanine--tRNA ligase subunit alpha [Acidobacteriota bacterium]NIM61004.1 phenylalanine--tRNA ligase subunit alpha [Acidobacteriota bacterium]NIO59972.1 phenylalanine--tRNA ligase subunit alpha [Acidobacteriota bacterium]NIQ31044.1 phenylalanine--tRNA ligase subunit alpha [Acidobacteriota bacterium]NIQ86172.1 phenylalanine--tRNA ligase subunit alpha [Acidobacteriota bacterium]
MQSTLQKIEREFEAALASAGADPKVVDEVRVRYLGRKGEITGLMKQLRELPKDQRKEAGQAINRLKRSVQERLENAIAAASSAQRDAALAGERADVTLPPLRPWAGSLHPVTQTRRELERVFRDLGFTIEDGPEVEDDFHNFQALNMPPDHPARDATDTFYLADGNVLRTHTSPVQIRTMETRRPPIKMICPGRVYRRDLDATHLPMFHQLEALVVGEAVSMADLKGTLEALWTGFYGAEIRMRLRPGYFPFVEPGCEYDISCRVCGGDGCRVCKRSGWIELGGAGMVHPAVFEAVGIDPQRYSGFAFGLGIDRIAMMRHGIDDLRLLMENDVRFLRQFPEQP